MIKAGVEGRRTMGGRGFTLPITQRWCSVSGVCGLQTITADDVARLHVCVNELQSAVSRQPKMLFCCEEAVALIAGYFNIQRFDNTRHTLYNLLKDTDKCFNIQSVHRPLVLKPYDKQCYSVKTKVYVCRTFKVLFGAEVAVQEKYFLRSWFLLYLHLITLLLKYLEHMKKYMLAL